MAEPNNPYQPPRGPLRQQPRHRLAAADSSSVAGAFGFTLVAHAIYVFGGGALALAFAGSSSMLDAFMPAMFISVGQLLYMVPMFVFARRRGRFAFAKGLVICAAITSGLNGACFGVLLLG